MEIADTIFLRREGSYIVKEHSDSKSNYTEDGLINMLAFIVDKIFMVFGGKVFQQIVGIPIGTIDVPLIDDISLYSYEAEFIQSLLSAGKKQNLSSTSHIDTSMTYIQSVIQILRLILVICIPLSLR